jgi:GT2 family glycosyltransferase/glycosyltransferase involved in cell wall biosynthesis
MHHRDLRPAGTMMTGSTPIRRILAVLATYGRRDVTLAGLATLVTQRLPEATCIDVLVIDDGSPDDTVAAIRARYPAIEIVQADGSLWWAGAMARGLAAAAAGPSDFHLWLNDDVLLDSDAIARLLAIHDASPGAVVVGTTRDPIQGGRSYGGQRLGRHHPFRLEPVVASDTATSCDTFQGNIALVPAAVTRRLGGIDPAFIGVQGMADTDFGLRATAIGITLLAAPGSHGLCAPNLKSAPWTDRSLPLPERLSAIVGPRGYHWRGWTRFARRHGGRLWPVWLLMPYPRCLLAALRPTGGPVRVALLEGTLPPYRVAQINALAGAGDVAFTVYYGPAPAGFPGRAKTEGLDLPARRARHGFWPGGGGRIGWSGGSFAAMLGHDVVVAGLHVHDLGIWLCWLARRLCGRPRLVLSGHFRLGPAAGGGWERLRNALRRAMARGADAALPYGAAGAADCLDCGIPADRIFVQRNSLDVAAIRRVAATIAPEDIAARRHELDLTEKNIFLFVGRVYARKRLDLAIEAITNLRDSGLDCALVIVGDGPDIGRVRDLAADRLGIRFVGPEFDERRLASLFGMSLAVVVPDAVGLVVAHAAAYGRPLVTCRGEAHGPEIADIEDGFNACVSPTADAAGLAGVMARLVREPDLAARLSAGAAATADRLGVAAIAAATLSGIRRALVRR